MSKHTDRRRKAKALQMIWAAATPDCPMILLHAPLSLEAATSEDGAPRKGPRRYEMLAYGGGELVVEGYPLPVVVNIAGARTRTRQIPNYFGHDDGSDGTRLVGHSDEIDKAGGKTIVARGAISAVNDFSRQILSAHDNGYEWQASIGVLPDRGSVKEIGSGKPVIVNGRTFTGPILVAQKGLLRHIAILPEGADPSTRLSIAASAAPERKEHDMEFDQWVKTVFGGEAPELTDAQNAKLHEKYDGEVKAAASKEPIGGKASSAVGAPTFDLSGILRVYEVHAATVEAKAAGYTGKIDAGPLAEIRGKAQTAAAELKLKALNEEWPATRLEVGLIRAQAAVEVELIRAERPKGPQIRASGRDLNAPVIEAAMCQSLGMPNIEKQFSAETLQAAHTEFRGRIGLQQVLLMAASANGYSCRPGDRVHDGNLREVLSYACPPLDIRAGFADTLNLPKIFENVANKELLAGFMEEDQVWRDVGVTKPVNDFKTVTSYRLLDDMEYEELPPGGEMKHGQLGEETYTRRAKTYAKMFSLDRTDIVNDDMGALDDLRTRLGRGAARKFNRVFWARFLDNSTFFTAARGNYISGATTTLLIDYVGLERGITAFDALKSTAVPPAEVGMKIGGTPSILLVPPELTGVADRIWAAVAAAKTSDVNLHSGKYRPVKATQLSDSTYTGSSATAWYLLRNPQTYPAVVVSLLNGNANPIVESAMADFKRLSLEYRGYHDFGADLAEWLCGVKSKGAA